MLMDLGLRNSDCNITWDAGWNFVSCEESTEQKDPEPHDRLENKQTWRKVAGLPWLGTLNETCHAA